VRDYRRIVRYPKAVSAEVGAAPGATAQSRLSARDEQIPLAIFYMIASGAVFTCSSAASKWLVASYPIGELLFSRTFVSLVLLSAFVLPAGGFTVYRTQRLGAHDMRACSQAASQSMLLVAFMLMPLAGATDVPTVGLLIGSAVVIASGMFLFWRQSRRVPVEEPDA
jgi:hypothetical protein